MDLSYLNEAQKEAVLYSDGPMMILAGAGSGKTRTLVSKIQYLLNEKKIPSFNILAMTFSNKAAREMRERVEMLNDGEASMFITTFHSFCARVLRGESNYLGLSKNFTIYDDSESLSVIKTILGRRGLSQKEISPHEVKYYIGWLKNWGHFKDCDKFEIFSDEDEVDKEELFYEMYLEYEQELHTSNAIDFGGLIVGVLELFCKHPQILERYQKRFKYILVDEYQDTNRSQFLLIRMLAKSQNICVVGDEDQSIYSWRGADINNILDFEKYFDGIKVFKLEQNYRSSENIIKAASHVINHNLQRKGKNLWTENPQGDSIDIVECVDDTIEANYITKKIEELKKENVPYSEVAIFYRNNSQARMIEDALRKKHIPYRIIGGIKFYDRKEIKDVLSYLKLLNNVKDSLSFSRIVNAPARGVGAVSLRKLEQEAMNESISLYEMVKKLVENYENYSHLKLSKKVKSSLVEFVTLMEETRLMDASEELPSLCCEKLIEESGYLMSLKEVKSYENMARIENIKELLNAVKQYEYICLQAKQTPSVGDFLETVTLDQNIDEEQSEGQVSLMTVHGSKGLEYEHVILAGVEENLFPSIMSLEEGEDRLEEERRLFYVAMTRAMKKLNILFCKSRMMWGKFQFQEPSRFLFEIPEEYASWISIGKKGGISSKKKQSGVHVDYDDEYSQVADDDFDALENKFYNAPKSQGSDFSEGLLVRHSLYGDGVVLRTEGDGPNEKITIKFDQGATKKFLTKFAPIEILS